MYREWYATEFFCAVRVRSDVPITVQGISHIFERGHYDLSRAWAVLDARPIARVEE